MRIALIQLSAGADKAANVDKAVHMTREALESGARFVLLPEVFNFRGDIRNPKIFPTAVETVPGPTTNAFLSLAEKYQAHILLGSLLEKSTQQKAYNASVLIGPRKKIVAKYRKIHLFDARLGDKIIREADCFKPGRTGVSATIGEFKLGLTICYDVRFSDLYQKYVAAGVNVLTVPSCFTKTTGMAHWEVLVRARAIENLSYVLAPNQVGVDARGMLAHGHSMVISPWGEILARGSADQEEIIFSDIHIEEVHKARMALPGIIISSLKENHD